VILLGSALCLNEEAQLRFDRRGLRIARPRVR
jgi:hypothetical protein